MNLQLTSPLAPGCGDQVLGSTWVAAAAARPSMTWPEQHLASTVLGAATPTRHECWIQDPPMRSGRSEGIVWRRNAEVLFGVIELDEAAFADADAPSPLQVASQVAYERLFRLLDAQRLPHLWRIWNYLADINGESHGLERYRQFNIGRQDAFIAQRRDATGNVPAACALGVASGPLSIAFLAGSVAPLPIENPRQISAYHYPASYGPRAPTFSRAALVPAADQDILFISGTASIVGHQTVHLGDVEGQTRESLANIAVVVQEANRQARFGAFTLTQLSYRVYLRDPADLARVRDVLIGLLGEAEVVYVRGDICRADLLVEIEATGFQPAERP